ncbi:MAG: tryptophan 2,3-dioxygenase family protein [Flavobacteriales bacterium]|mgnify:CR=1 FL=1|nr:tryptophan 2,3-dioxygenase family protein [Flavobacteriales bacterium]
MKTMYYSSYLQLDKILGAQELESDNRNQHAHDEMLFIVIHQAYELWFKQILFEISSVRGIMSSESINDNSPELQVAVRRLNRVVEILRLLVHQVDVLETMTPLDFLDFRDILRPASGFQSMQFKEMEAMLGLTMPERHGQQYYTSQLTKEDSAKIFALENQVTVLQLVNQWLERMPYFIHPEFWDGWEHGSDFWSVYREVYSSSLGEGERENIRAFEELFLSDRTKNDRKLSDKARRSALFIMLYRDYPILQNPYRFLNQLLEIDELLANWRWRHMNMVHRMIGTRTGTGGSSGKGYLREAALKHYIFSEIAELNSFLIERRKLPKLSNALERKLGFNL